MTLGRRDGVDVIGLALAVAHLPIRSIHLDHTDPAVTEMPSQPGPIGTGALDTNLVDLTETLEPSAEIGVMASTHRERLNAKSSAVGVDRGCDMEVEVGVNPTSDQGPVLYDGQRHPFRYV